jgi:hypothetical protein
MKRRHPRRTLLAALLSVALAANAQDASVDVYGFDSVAGPIADFRIRVDGVEQTPNQYGALRLVLPAGEHQLEIMRAGKVVSTLPLVTKAGEVAELIVNFETDGRATVSLESSAQSTRDLAEKVEIADPGTLEGQVVSAETGKPIAGARVYIAGTPLDLTTDAEGRFSAEIPGGTYSVSVLAPSFASQTLDAVEVPAKGKAQRNIELTPAGLELAEYVVTEPFVEGSLAAFVEERRTSAAVTDILGAEQISRAGDSDAAGALKRVTGLTLVDGKYIYVRGLGERYSSTLLNGAQVPSPDPTRRVVPLDLFPTEVLQGIVVQKTYSADMPGEFGGGTIQLRTRGVPENFFVRIGATIEYADGTTGKDGLRYDGGERDWTGFDDDVRYAPSVFGVPRLPSNPTELEAAGEELAALGYNTREDSLAPNASAGFGIGDKFEFGDRDISLGYIAAARYAHSWDDRLEQRNTYSLFQGGLLPAEDFERRNTERSIDNSLFAALGLEVGEHHSLNFTATQLRQTTDQAQIDEGLTSSGNIDRITELEWVENSLQTLQLDGEHSLPQFRDLYIKWQVTDSKAKRYSPNTREYRFTFDEQVQDFIFESFNQQRIDDLDDDATDYGIDLRMPFNFGEGIDLTVQAGAALLERDRVSSIRRFRFTGRRPPGPIFDFEELLQPENIGPNGLRLEEGTLASDNYTATQKLEAWYLMFDGSWGEWRANLGVRREDMRQEVITVRPFDPSATPEIGLLDNSDDLPAASLTWAYSENAQFRAAYSTTLSRPDIREQSRANFVDPILDVRVEGNPDLKQAEIENIDVRWEYYFNSVESFSVALFSKDFSNPIELVSVPASGNLLQIRNADSATNVGIEFDLYKSFAEVGSFEFWPRFMRELPWSELYLGANYAWIDSEIDLGDNQGIQTNAKRPLQGQSKYVANVSISWQPADGLTEATLLYNVFGERISRVGVSGLPDIVEEPFDQLDFTMSRTLPWPDWKMKLRLRNLLDPEVRFSQGGEPTRTYTKGREVALSVEWKF